ncbi:uncharacterized protein LOC123545775 [Mercenaria mercenaria]|uniref:uncharacterized protein LOC123545775 n=1 Tax=Mercenaria mercenaria TaxID=6596 RepID=UPI00234E6BD9|nr:uncharacterized protein LOC123545775 [Mercenaria mercenaria]
MAGKTLLRVCFWIILARFCHTTSGTCITPEDIAHGNMSYSGIDEGDTVTYTCNVGYIITSTSATRTCINGQWSGSQPTCAGIVCNPNSINVYNLPLDHYYNAIQNVTRGGLFVKCNVSDINSTTVTITGCLKDLPIIFTIGTYHGIELYTLLGGKDLVIVKIVCNEISENGTVLYIEYTIYNAGLRDVLGDIEQEGINLTYEVTSSLSSTSVIVGNPVAWTINFPSEYILEVTSCKGYPGTDAQSNHSVNLISSGGCSATSELITHFSDALDGTVTATLSTFKFYNYDNVFLTCVLKVCPSSSVNCDTTCSRAKRGARHVGTTHENDAEETRMTTVHNVLKVIDLYSKARIPVSRVSTSLVLALTFIHIDCYF